MNATTAERIDDLVHAWTRWARHPGSERTARARTTATRNLAGHQATDLHRHISEHLRERSPSIREAITTWLDLQDTTTP